MKPSTRFSSKIIKAGALLDDVKVLLLRWDETKSIEENLRLALTTNVFGKVSRSRVEDVLKVIRGRYCRDNGAVVPLHRLVKWGVSPEVIDRLLFYYAALADPLIYTFVADYLYPMHLRGEVRVTVEDALRFIQSAIREGKIQPPWSDYTRLRVARGLLSALRDFHVLEGAVQKRFAPVHLPLAVFVCVAFSLRQHVAGERVVDHKDWRLFLYRPVEVDRLFLEAQQHGYVRYEALGQIVRIDFPYKALTEVVDDLVARRSGDALG